MKASGVSSTPDRHLGSSDGFESKILEERVRRISELVTRFLGTTYIEAATSIISAIPNDSRALQATSLQRQASAALEEEKPTSSATKSLEFNSYKEAQIALFDAIKENDIKKVEEILSNEDLKNKFINKKLIYDYKDSSSLCTPLSYAISLGLGNIVDLLIKHGANAKEYLYVQGIHLLHEAKTADIAQKLIDAGANIDFRDSKGETLLFKASKLNLIDLVNFLLEKGAYFTIPNKDGLTPVMIAIENGNIEIARLLIEKGADIYQKISEGMSCLKKAFIEKNKQFIQNFLRLAADFNIKNKSSNNLLLTALLLSVRYDTDLVDDETFEYLIKKTKDIDEKNCEGCTPLLFAIILNRVKIIELLLSARANVNVSSPENHSSLHFVVIHKASLEIVQLLVKAGADVNAKDSSGNTPIDIAINRNELEIAKALKEAGAICNIDAKNPDGNTKLQLAIEKGDLGEVKALIELGANINAKTTTINNFGITPLMLSMIYDRDEITSFLLEQKNIDVKAADPNGVTTFMYAVCRNKSKAAKVLIRKGADKEAKDSIGLKAHQYSYLNRFTSITDSETQQYLLSIATRNTPIDEVKPNALVILPKNDPNKEFSIERKLHFFASLAKGYNVQVRYVSSIEELNELLKERTYKNLSILGHGLVNGNGIILTDKLSLTKENIKEIQFDNLDDEAKIFSVACNVGREDGLADEIAKTSKKEVIAATDKVSFFSTKVTTNENGETDLEFYETPGSDKNLTRKIKI